MTTLSSYADVGAIIDQKQNYDELMTEHAPFVKRIAYHMIARLPANIHIEDMVQAGMIGLFDALKGYDKSKGASFETYSRIRIQGAMIDEVRRCDWTPRSVYKKSRQLSEAIRSVEREKGRDAKDSEIAELLDVSLDEYYGMVNDAAGCKLLSYEEMTLAGGSQDEYDSGEFNGPYKSIEAESFQYGLAEKISHLPEREKLVVSLYYDDEFNLREIGEILGITEGRVCQIHSQALLRLKAHMTDWLGENSAR